MSEQLIASYVKGRWYVSTILRESSAVRLSGVRYYETIIWAFDPETRKTGAMIDCREGGLEWHMEACWRLLEGVPLDDEEKEED